MSIERITPRMQKALRDGKPLSFFADIWSSVLNDSVDSQAEWQSSAIASNVDTAFNPGFARLATQLGAYSINQTTAGSAFKMWGGGDSSTWHPWVFQKVLFKTGRILSKVTIKVKNYGVAHINYRLYIYDVDPRTLTANISPHNTAFYNVLVSSAIYSQTQSTPIGFDGDLAFSLPNLQLIAGNYYILFVGTGYVGAEDPAFAIYTSTVDTYPDGSFIYQVLTSNGYHDHWQEDTTKDMYFKLEVSGFIPAGGRIVTKVMDLGEAPLDEGVFQMAYEQPVGTALTVQLTGSVNADLSSPTVLSDVDDGQALPAGLRYWQADITMNANADLSVTPQLDMLEILYPKTKMLLREKGKALDHVAADLLADYHAMLTPLSFQTSDIKIIERVSGGGTISCDIEDPDGSAISRLVSDSPLINYRGTLSVGADVEGFSKADLLRFWIGTISTATYKPKYRNPSAKLSLKFKNPILDLKRKVPQPVQTGLISFDTLAINHDGLHVVDSMLDLMRGKAGIPARYINIASFVAAKAGIGVEYLIRRSNASGLSDTRIQNPDEVQKFLGQLAILADGYITVDESSRITFARHDLAAASEADWADETMVRELGTDAVPIEGVDSLDLGYESLLYNCVILGCDWNVLDDSWTGFAKVYANVNSTSADDMAPGKEIFISVMEKNMKDASKWLGPESKYHGETIAQTLAARYTARFGYPPVVMKGVTVPNSEFMRTLGSVVRIWSREFVKFKRRGIAVAESKKFMIMSKKYDQGKNRMLFDLLELT